jgi:hypothetical protein
MHIDSLAFRHAQTAAALFALAAVAFVVLTLLAYAVLQLTVTGVPSVDGPQLAPFRWTPIPVSVA